MVENQNGTLEEINELLKEVKIRLNKNYKAGDQFTLTIEDKYKGDTTNDPTEDIELKIKSIRLSRKS
jgi:hypothetical protein